MAGEPEKTPVIAAEQKTAAIGHFKDWTNYLLVTTVAALGWVSTQTPDVLAVLCALCLAVSIIFGIFTLALIPLVTEQLRDDSRSIYEVDAKFTIWWMCGRQHERRLKHFCWPQHVTFLVGIALFAARFLSKADGLAL